MPVKSVPRTLLDLDFEFVGRSDGLQLAVEFSWPVAPKLSKREFAVLQSKLALVCVKKALSIVLEIMSSDFDVPRFDPIAQGAGYDREHSSGVEQ